MTKSQHGGPARTPIETADLCASGQQVRALEARPWVVFDAVFRFLKDDAKTQEVFDAITSALTTAPQAEPMTADQWRNSPARLAAHGIAPAPSAATPTAQEAVPVAIPRHPTQAMMDAGLYHMPADAGWADLRTAWTAMFDAAMLDGGTSDSAPSAHPPQPSETVAEALHNLICCATPYMRDEAQMLALAEAKAALRALKGEA
ncbi:hypothetical protein NM680_13290 [Paracoccus sp. PS-1]|uniref:hypothetical protein n=1 Tax=Paracoccus sp. PS1 TaxID=2963938 RepID=UPI0027E45BF6|nr:hypothetical protein [Paracoccus sp. PS1]MDQ7262767.1 hypothetical protein [Paracoccus sp. PS1]